MKKDKQRVFNSFKNAMKPKKKKKITGFYLSNPKYDMKDVLRLLGHIGKKGGFNGMLVEGTELAFTGTDGNGNDLSNAFYRYIDGDECDAAWVQTRKINDIPETFGGIKNF